MYADHEDHAVYESECVLEHEVLHLTVVAPSPVGPREEGPADLDLPACGVVRVKAGRSDDAASLRIQREQRAARGDRFVEERPEDGRPIAIRRRVLFPDQRIRCDREERLEVFSPKRPELEKVSLQCGLEIERHIFATRRLHCVASHA